SILGMPTFRESCNPLHQGEEQPDTRSVYLVSDQIPGIRLFLALMKWTARFTKRWHSKNGFEHGENPRSTRLSYRKHPWKPQEYY
ncbi:hypothetical protein ALC60_04254, partial [Trachymyrmex zeteki]